jgi:hypothetical protein
MENCDLTYHVNKGNLTWDYMLLINNFTANQSSQELNQSQAANYLNMSKSGKC